LCAAGAAEFLIEYMSETMTAETLDADAVVSCLTAIREAIPRHAARHRYRAPGSHLFGRARHRAMHAWFVVLDCCSVNLKEEDAIEVIGR
jgi:hypothetical protein